MTIPTFIKAAVTLTVAYAAAALNAWIMLTIPSVPPGADPNLTDWLSHLVVYESGALMFLLSAILYRYWYLQDEAVAGERTSHGA